MGGIRAVAYPSRPCRCIATSVAATGLLALYAYRQLMRAARSRPSAAYRLRSGRYIVALSGKPIALRGDVKGLVQPARERRASGRVLRSCPPLRDYLKREHANAAARVGAKPLQALAGQLNGFATTLTPDRRGSCKKPPAFCRCPKIDHAGSLVTEARRFLEVDRQPGCLGGKRWQDSAVAVWSSESWIRAIGRKASRFSGEAWDGSADVVGSLPTYRSGQEQDRDAQSGWQQFQGICEAGDSFTGKECKPGDRRPLLLLDVWSQTPPGQRPISCPPVTVTATDPCCINGRWQRWHRASVGGTPSEDSGRCSGGKAGDLQSRLHRATDDQPASTAAERWPLSMPPLPMASM